jgi:UDP-N-acetylmuramate--L-alanine ligase
VIHNEKRDRGPGGIPDRGAPPVSPMRTKAEIKREFAPAESLDAGRGIYLVGIGGAGMSALARMLKRRGVAVRGSDAAESGATAALESLGVPVRIGHSGSDVAEGDQVVLSDAIALEDSPEVAAARKLGCKLFRRSQLLGWMLKDKKVIAVTGTHGKSTMTGMIGAGLREAGFDPTIVVGAEVPEFGGAVVEGAGDVAVVEACEAYEGFLDIEPHMVVLTNLEPDHLDYHGSFDQLLESMVRFVCRLGARGCDGALVYCAEDAGAAEVARRASKTERIPSMPYGAAAPGGALVEGHFQPHELALPGRHNLLNAEGALLACERIGADRAAARRAIAKFGGAERRLQVVQDGSITLIDDYAHHPTEIEASIRALRERYPGRRIVTVFQPHLYSRTALHLDGFASSLSLADHVVLTDIYPAREKPLPGVSSARIAEKVSAPVDYVPCRHLLPRHVAALAAAGDVIVTMGAGNIASLPASLLREMGRGGRCKVAVVYGGDSAEREVSLLSGRAVCDALKSRGYDAWTIDVSEALLAAGDLSAFVCSERPDLAFLCVHGTHAEDGAIQGLFELLHVPYTGSGIQSSAIAMDKARTKEILAAHGVPTPPGGLVWSVEETARFRTPAVVKPNAQGSTVGLSFVDDPSELERAVARALRYGSGALIEEWIKGVEISAPVLIDEALPVVEIVPKSGVYDFASKYLPGATEEIVPARIAEPLAKRAQEAALQTHRLLGCRGATRTDMVIRDGVIYVLEINTIPGMTATSLLPNSARAAGISFEELCDRIAREALERHAAKT